MRMNRFMPIKLTPAAGAHSLRVDPGHASLGWSEEKGFQKWLRPRARSPILGLAVHIGATWWWPSWSQMTMTALLYTYSGQLLSAKPPLPKLSLCISNDPQTWILRPQTPQWTAFHPILHPQREAPWSGLSDSKDSRPTLCTNLLPLKWAPFLSRICTSLQDMRWSVFHYISLKGILVPGSVSRHNGCRGVP